MRPLLLGMSLALTVFNAACNENPDRFENIQKLRGLGVISSPAVSAPSTAAAPSVVTLTFYAALPKGDSVTAEPFVDEPSGFQPTFPVDLKIDATKSGIDQYSTLDVYHVEAKLTIPPAEALYFQGVDDVAAVPYGILLSSKANGSQKIIGKAVVYKAGSPALTSLASGPTVSISSPTKGATLSGKQDLRAEAKTVNTEDLRVGWFVNAGEIKNPASGATSWDPKKTTGNVTLIVTARGTKSGSMAIDVIDITLGN